MLMAVYFLPHYCVGNSPHLLDDGHGACRQTLTESGKKIQESYLKDSVSHSYSSFRKERSFR